MFAIRKNKLAETASSFESVL